MSIFKLGAITKEVKKGAEKWYLMAGWKKIEEKEKSDKTNSKKITTA